jgi:hypothetical protein
MTGYLRRTKLILQLFILVLFFSSCQTNSKHPDKVDSPKIMPPISVDTTLNAFLDTARDEKLDSFLDSLPQTSDTTAYQVDLNKGRRNFKLSDYGELRDATGNEKGIVGIPLSNYYVDILPFSGSEKLYFDLIAGLAREALYLSDRKNFIFGDSGNGRPAQIGLAYSWGSKLIDARKKPPGKGDTCSYQVYGLDCSGFIYQLFLRNKIKFPIGPAALQCQVTTLKNALLPYFGSADKFQVTDLSNLGVSQMRTGDIIYFRNNNNDIVHIGLCLNNAQGQLSFYESSGSPNFCVLNIDVRKGVRGVILDKRIGSEGRKYSIVRITPGI